MNQRKRFLTLVVVLITIMALLPGVAMAGSVTQNGVTLNFPNSYTSCEPANTIWTTGVDPAWKVVYKFYKIVGGSLVQIGGGTAWGNISVPFPYPPVDEWPVINPTTGARALTFGVDAFVTNQAGSPVAKLRGKWVVTCVPQPKPSPTPTFTAPPPSPTPTKTATPPPPGGDGCTPGYWRQDQHFDSWVPTGYAPGNDFETVFGVNASFNPHTLLDAVWLGGGGENALARHAVAALLNASHPSVDYEYSAADVISMVQQAYASGDFEDIKDLFDAANNAGCPLN